MHPLPSLELFLCFLLELSLFLQQSEGKGRIPIQPASRSLFVDLNSSLPGLADKQTDRHVSFLATGKGTTFRNFSYHPRTLNPSHHLTQRFCSSSWEHVSNTRHLEEFIHLMDGWMDGIPERYKGEIFHSIPFEFVQIIIQSINMEFIYYLRLLTGWYFHT